MGFCINVEEVPEEEISLGVVRRILLNPENTGRGPPGDLKVTHYTLTKGGILEFDDKGVEFQHFIISGSTLFSKQYLHSNYTVFIPTDRKHRFIHAGESELRIISTTYSTPRPSHIWCKTRIAMLSEPYEQQLMTEEFHALTGAQRLHAIDIQTWDRDPHTNPEETAYFLRGKGEMLVGDTWYKVRPGSLVYSEEGAIHGVKNTDEKSYSLQYYVMEYTEQDKMWSQRGYRDT